MSVELCCVLCSLLSATGACMCRGVTDMFCVAASVSAGTGVMFSVVGGKRQRLDGVDGEEANITVFLLLRLSICD